jgi:hypothetical protein
MNWIEEKVELTTQDGSVVSFTMHGKDDYIFGVTLFSGEIRPALEVRLQSVDAVALSKAISSCMARSSSEQREIEIDRVTLRVSGSDGFCGIALYLADKCCVRVTLDRAGAMRLAELIRECASPRGLLRNK